VDRRLDVPDRPHGGEGRHRDAHGLLPGLPRGRGCAGAVRGALDHGEEKYHQVAKVEAVEYNAPIDPARFALPAPPPPDFAISGGKASTTVPFELLNNLVKVASLELGDATLRDQVFAVFPLASLGQAEGVVPQWGLVGYEIFKRFVVKVDYERSQLTLTLPPAFSYTGEGTVVPFKFNEHIPQVEGEIDDLPGQFDIDTGSRSSLDLLGPFVEKHDLKARYAPKVEGVTGWGVGGGARSLVTRAKTLRLGGVTVAAPVTELSLQKTTAAGRSSSSQTPTTRSPTCSTARGCG